MSALDELIALAPPPLDPTPTRTVINADGLSLPLPADYRALLETYGTGTFDRSLNVFAPEAIEVLDLIARTREDADMHREVAAQWGPWLPYPLWPEPGCLVMWGQIDGAECFYWLTHGPPNQWPVIITRSDETEHEQIPQNSTELILALLTDPETLTDLLPRDLVAVRHRFLPVGPPPGT